MLIDLFNIYKKGLFFGSNGEKIDRSIFLINYYLKYHIEDALRNLKGINDIKCYNYELYGDINKKQNKISYYHHLVVSLLMNLALINSGNEKLHGKIGGSLFEIEFSNKARNTIAHIFDKIDVYSKLDIKLNGFNVIFDKDDFKLYSIKKPIGTLDLINNKILIHGNNHVKRKPLETKNIEDASVDLIKLKSDLDSANASIKEFDEFISNFFIKND